MTDDPIISKLVADRERINRLLRKLGKGMETPVKSARQLVQLRRQADAIPVGTDEKGNRTYRVGKRRSWLLVPIRIPNRVAKALVPIVKWLRGKP